MVDEVKDTFDEKTDSKAISILIRWGYKGIFGQQNRKK
jgi:hypothetical protein